MIKVSFPRHIYEDDNVESSCSMIGKIPPKGVSFSDFICTFAMSFGDFAILVCSTKVGEKSDMA